MDKEFDKPPTNRAQAWFRVVLWILPSATCASLDGVASWFRREFVPFGAFIPGPSSGPWWVSKFRWVAEMNGDHLLLIGFILAIAAGWYDTRLRVRRDSDWCGSLLWMIGFVVAQPVIAFFVFIFFFNLMAKLHPGP
jgi:hypothetical protein